MENGKKYPEEILKNPAAEELLSDLFDNERDLVPEFDLDHGYRHIYAEEILDMTPDETKAFLEKIVEAGLLFKELYDKTLRCPKCDSPNVSITYTCPFDESINIIQDALIEHLACGYIDAISKFRQDEGLICPQCKETLTPGSYRTSGSWNQCQECGKRLEVLSVVHRCRKCDTKFTFEDSHIGNAYTYSLLEMGEIEFGLGASYVPHLRDIFEKNGFTVERLPVLEGESGIEYAFDLVASNRDGREVTIDLHFLEEQITREALIEKYGKYVDTRKESYLLIAPPLHNELDQLVKSIEMNIIQAETPSEALQLFSQKFGLEKKEKSRDQRGFLSNLITKLFGTRPRI